MGPTAQTTRFGDRLSQSDTVEALFRLRSIGIVGKKKGVGSQAERIYVGCEDAIKLELTLLMLARIVIK